MVLCYNLYVFNRQGACVHYHEWARPKPVSRGAGTALDDQKQMFGLLWTLGNLTAALDPKNPSPPPLGAPRRIGDGARFHSYATDNYALHYLESPSGLRLALNTSPDAGDLREVLAYIYESLYIEYVVKNPLYTPGQPFSIEPFTNALNAYLRFKGLLQQPGV